MRVAIVAASLDILGGQGVQAHALVRSLREDGVDARLIAVNPRFPAGLQLLRRVPYARTVLNELLYLPGLLHLAAFDVAHVFSASYASFLLAPVPAMLVARMLNKRVVLHYHSGEAEDHLANWGALVHPWLALADEIVVPSSYLREVFARFGHRARVIPNVVDLTTFDYRERRPLRPRLLSTRNLERHYRVDVIIEAFAHYQAGNPDAMLTIAGYGSEESRLRAMAAQLTRGGVRFLGKIDPAWMPRLYADSDIYLNASEVDNQPVSILEAFASGMPVISTPTGDIASMVRHGETGLIVPPEAPMAMAGAIAETLHRPARALQMAEQAHDDLDRFTWAAVREEWQSVYSGAGVEALGPEVQRSRL
ncbi:MAG: glycosyltransferase family 1 protein [Acidobacteria bacterium]|nr:MAG: glycosyltransferase family 1 protein [Acidobacteriota bacterium]